MDYKEMLLNKLLDKYEKSKSTYTSTNRRIILKMKELKEYNIENFETKKVFHDIIYDLKSKNIIDYSWEMYENGNILKEIWLNKKSVDKAYLMVNRVDIKKQNSTLLEYLQKYQFNQNWIEQYRTDMIRYIEQKHKTNSMFPYGFAKDILKVLNEIDNKNEVLKRVLSINCFGDSKYFEKNIEHIIIRIIKKYLSSNEEIETYTNDDILLEVGISKYPEVLEFCGDLEYDIKTEKIEYKKETMRKLY